MNPLEIRKRLDELERASKLEKALDSGGGGAPWAEIVWMLQFPAMIGLAIQVTTMALAVKPDDPGPSPAEMAWSAVLVLPVLLLRFGWKLVRSPRERTQVRLRRKGLVVLGAIVQANDRYFYDDNEDWLPGSMLVSFDPKARPEALAAGAQKINALKRQDRRTLPPAQAALAWDLYHEMGPSSSLPVPPELVGGLRDCLLVSAMLPPKPLDVDGCFWVLALPGERSADAVAVLPATLVD